VTAEEPVEPSLYLLDAIVQRLGEIAEDLVFVLPGKESCALCSMGSTI
jgi:hypothetical protein